MEKYQNDRLDDYKSIAYSKQDNEKGMMRDCGFTRQKADGKMGNGIKRDDKKENAFRLRSKWVA